MPKKLCVTFAGLTAALAAAQSAPGGDGWPMGQRTPTRLGRTSTVGPRTPTIAWRVLIDPKGPSGDLSSAVMDGEGRVFVPHSEGVAAVDSKTREVLWQFRIFDAVSGAPVVRRGKVLFGAATDFFYCVDAETGREIWSAPAAPHPNFSPVADTGGVVYYTSQNEVMYARRIDDGELLWTAEVGCGTISSPSLDLEGRIFTSSEHFADVSAHRTSDGERLWRNPAGRGNLSTHPVDLSQGENGQVYTAGRGGRLVAVDRVTGEEIWTRRLFDTTTGAVAVGHDGTVYVATVCCDYWLFAFSPAGDQLWRYDIGGAVKFPPIIDGDGIIYFCANFWTGAEWLAWVHAVRPDGTTLWKKQMPERTVPSPMLAPDGTLYIVSNDKHLYAFRDLRGDMNCDGSVDLADVQPFIMALLDPDKYQRWNPDCNAQLADMTEDGSIDLTDVEPFIECILGERCP